ncbi:MAG: FAD-dependent oxidoreductase [Deltaproteobacteria bacterium]|nr:FAD-dependent oxidoreductase [Deltaproteobacteria bacterium]
MRGASSLDDIYDCAIVGAGFGGLGAALALAEQGARVVVFEAFKLPGGCASTFVRDGFAFEAGATLFSGLGPRELFGRWNARHHLGLTFDWLDPVVTLRTPRFTLPALRDREAFLQQLCALPEVPERQVRAFFDEQRRVADALWTLFDDPTLLPPLSLRALVRHGGRVRQTLALLPLVGRPLGEVLERHCLSRCAPLVAWLDAVCQITVQCSAAEAEAPFALGAMDYFWRGTGHVRGGIGALAWGLLRAVERLGGAVRLADRVQAIESEGELHRVRARRGSVRARSVVLNLLPGDARRLLQARAADEQPLEDGWGAVMRYLVVDEPPDAPEHAHHVQVIADDTQPLVEGNHLFASISGRHDGPRAGPGQRTITLSTHLRLRPFLALPEPEQASKMEQIQARLRHTFTQHLPEWAARVRHELTASPRTFEKFTLRTGGLVGGPPRRAGLGNYRQLGPLLLAPRVFLVGDSVFPGQSTLATALGGVRTAEAILRALSIERRALFAPPPDEPVAPFVLPRKVERERTEPARTP